MEYWRVKLLGAPSATHEVTHKTAHLRTRQAWGLLASLLLDPHTCSRSTLALRFWPGGDERKSLGMALSSLRQEFGVEAFVADRDSVRADRSRFLTDVDQVASWEASADVEADRAHRLACLLEAARQIGGVFLSGYDPDRDPEGWVQRWQLDLEERHARLLLSLCEALRRDGRTDLAAEWERRTASLFPDNPAATERAWRQLQQEAEGPGLDPSPSLQRLAEARVRRMPVPERDALARLSIFPGRFTLREAAAVTGVAPTAVEGLHAGGFLAPRASGYQVPAEIRGPAQAYLPTSVEAELLGAHARQVVRSLPDLVYGMDGRPYPVTVWLPDLRVGAGWLVRQPPDLEGLLFVEMLSFLGLSDPLAVEAPLIDWCVAAASHPGLSETEQIRAMMDASKLALDLRRFGVARRLVLECLDRWTSTDPNYVSTQLSQLAIACHHAEEPEEAATCIQEAMRIMRGRMDARREAAMLCLLAEIYSATDVDRAIPLAEEALSLRRRGDAQPGVLAASLYQWGSLLVARGANQEWGTAETALDEALSLFLVLGEQNGVADCLRALARLRADQGLLGEATLLAREAIRRYEELSAAPARAAALGVLGDILRHQNRLEDARQCFEEGLSYWRSLGHRRWTSQFENHLASLESLCSNASERQDI